MTEEYEPLLEEEVPEAVKPKLGFWGTIAFWILLLAKGGMNRQRSRTKGQRPPSQGICGPINHGEDGHPWLWMEIETLRGYPLMGARQRQSAKDYFGAALKSIVGVEIDIQVQGWPYDLDKIDESQKKGLLGRPSQKILERHELNRQRIREELQRLSFLQQRVFVGVQMRDERSFLQRAMSQLMLWLGFSSLLTIGNEREIYQDQIQQILGYFNNNQVDVRLLTGKELATVIRHCIYRRSAKLPQMADGYEVIRSAGDLHRLTDIVARNRHHMIEVFGDEGSRYVTYMPVADLPNEFSVEWMFLGDKYGRPVEISARLFVKPMEDAKSDTSATLQIVQGALEHLAKSSGDPRSEIRRQLAYQRLALEVQERLNADDEPLVEVDAFVIVSDDSEDRLKANRDFVKARSAAGSRGVILEIDSAYHAEIRRQTYPGSVRTYDNHRQLLFCDGVATAMPHASAMIGGDGDLYGTVRGPVLAPFLYRHRDVLRFGVDTATGQVFIGPPGEGKSSMMVNCAFADAVNGMAVIYDEGKGDSKIMAGEDELLADVLLMDLSAPEMAGLLNPLYLGDNPKESRDLTLEVLWKCLGSEAERGWRRLVLSVVSDELEKHPDDPDMHRIIKERLLGADKADPDYREKRDIGLTLLGLLEAQYSEVIFAKGKPWREVADKYIRPGQVTFVVYSHLTPPTNNKADADLSEQERLAFMVRDLANVIYYKFAMDPEVPLAIYKDEIQIDKRMGGSVSSSHVSRIGRSKGSTISLGGQFLADVPEDFWDNTSTIYFFRFRTVESAQRAIELLGIAVEKGSPEEARLIDLMMGTRSSNRKDYEAIVKTYTGEVGLVELNQFYHGGKFVSNVEVVEKRRRQRAAEMSRLPYIRRAATAEAALAELMRIGVDPEIVHTPNGYKEDISRWVETILELSDDEVVVLLDERLQVMQRRDETIPQLPLIKPAKTPS